MTASTAHIPGDDARRPEDTRLAEDHLLVHPSGEIHIKSKRTRRRFRRLLVQRMKAALAEGAPEARILGNAPRLAIAGGHLERAARVASSVFGVHRITEVTPIRYASLDDLADRVADLTRDRIRGRLFAVRCRRRGNQGWTSEDAMRTIGARLYEDSRGVDLDHPEEEVRVEVYQDVAYLVTATHPGPSGLPLGAQEPSLGLVSGGFDSPVAAWMMMRRGSPVDFLHFKLECSVSEHALVVAHALYERWARGTAPLFWMVDFQPIRQALLDHVESRLRQVVLKQLMIATADALAERLGVHALVTGEAVGQVSSQTVSHLAAIDSYCHRAILRPLSGLLKEEIIARARRIGTEDISARAKEVCDLSDGPVAVSAKWSALAEAHDRLPAHLVEAALESLTVCALPDWFPGTPFVPVTAEPPDGVPVLGASDPIPPEGPFALVGRDRAQAASRLAARGRDVRLILPRPEAAPDDAR
ncbi:MAG: tRNA sulfurtransferase [Myxococcota bacterium]